MVVVVNLCRVIVLAVLVAAIVTGSIGIALILFALFLLGTAEVFADSASSTLLPSVVPREHLGIANSRFMGSSLLTNQLLLPPIGACWLARGTAIRSAVTAVRVRRGAVLITRVVVSTQTLVGARGSIRSDMAEGIRWLVGHPPMRTLALTIFTFNITFGAAWSVLVLYASERLGMNEVGFGLLTTAMAVGGIVGVTSYGRLERRFALADIMRVGLLIETFP